MNIEGENYAVKHPKDSAIVALKAQSAWVACKNTLKF